MEAMVAPASSSEGRRGDGADASIDCREARRATARHAAAAVRSATVKEVAVRWAFSFRAVSSRLSVPIWETISSI